ncbi:MAG: hypothetical protein HY926_01360 [Elusimicrobia bacterium]|nr:hypothetical protein [Elusimicrobiota bacterium]
MNWSSRIVGALVESVCAGLAAGQPPLAAPFDDVARFVDEAVGRMPSPQGLGVRLLAIAFDLSAFPSCGELFHRLDPEARAARLSAWRQSRLAVCRQFVRLHESLAVFRLYARLEPGE